VELYQIEAAEFMWDVWFFRSVVWA